MYLKHIRNLSYLGCGGESNSEVRSNSHFNSSSNNNYLNVNNFNNNTNNNSSHFNNNNNLHRNNTNFNYGSTCNNNAVLLRTQTTMHLGHFKEIQASYAMKIFFFLRDVYYRGVILILKKNKFFKMKTDAEGKWTFKGFVKKPAQASYNYAKKKSVNFHNINSNNTTTNNHKNLNIQSEENHLNSNYNLNSPNSNCNNNNTFFNSRAQSPIIKSGNFSSSGGGRNKPQNTNNNNNNNSKSKSNPNLNYESEFFGMDIFEKIEDFWANLFIDEFPDIRMTHSYFLFLANSNKKNIDLSKYIYDQYDQASKLKLNNSITTFVSLFYRQLIEKSVEELVNFILSFKLVDELVSNLNQQFLVNNPNYYLDLNAVAGKALAKENNNISGSNSNHLQVMKQLKESNTAAQGHGSNNSSGRNIINLNSAYALSINNNKNNLNLNLNLNTINEIENLEKSYKNIDEYFTSSGDNDAPMSTKNFNTNLNDITNNTKNLFQNLNNLNSNINTIINKDGGGKGILAN